MGRYLATIAAPLCRQFDRKDKDIAWISDRTTIRQVGSGSDPPDGDGQEFAGVNRAVIL
jgi:hypothetical protein